MEYIVIEQLNKHPERFPFNLGVERTDLVGAGGVVTGDMIEMRLETEFRICLRTTLINDLHHIHLFGWE